MPVETRFFFFYIDEFITGHWVPWLEGPLADAPPEDYQGARGFQEILGDMSATPRTRATEAYRLGLLSDRIVNNQQVPRGEIPPGWQLLIDGNLPITKIGNFAYFVGKKRQATDSSEETSAALSLISSVCSLYNCFEYDGRIYNTVAIYEFARQEIEQRVKRSLTPDELRYLCAAVVGTIENRPEYIIQPYVRFQPIERILFDLSNGEQRIFAFEEFEDIATQRTIRFNSVKKYKNSLYWADIERGLYTRATDGLGHEFIKSFAESDRMAASVGHENIAHPVFYSMLNNRHQVEIFEVAEEQFSNYSVLLSNWHELADNLYQLANASVEEIEFNTTPRAWVKLQKEIRAEKSQDIATDAADIALANLGGNLLDLEIVDLPEDRPVRAKRASKRSHTPHKTDYATRDQNNRTLGTEGEQFILRYEKARLESVGREDLAEKVVWSSQEIGDGLGYDIQSFDEDGGEIFIEVKTTRAGLYSDFYISPNEIDFAEGKGRQYKLMRLYNFPKNPKIFILEGPLREHLSLEPVSYRASIARIIDAE